MMAIAYEFGVEARIASFAHPKSVIEEGLKYEIVDLKDTIEKLDEQQKSKDEEISRLKEEVHGVRSEKQKSIRERNRLSLALRAKEED
jgi:predicted  nucleic acid-binding Zn-ribbon protein